MSNGSLRIVCVGAEQAPAQDSYDAFGYYGLQSTRSTDASRSGMDKKLAVAAIPPRRQTDLENSPIIAPPIATSVFEDALEI
jgi:hypothetical protein